jgi:hypothetical protein
MLFKVEQHSYFYNNHLYSYQPYAPFRKALSNIRDFRWAGDFQVSAN